MKSRLLVLPRARKEGKRPYTVVLYGTLASMALTCAMFVISELEPEEKVSANRGASLFAIGLLFFASLYNFCVDLTHKTQIGQSLVKRYKLSTGDVYDISNKVVSAVQALLSCLTGWTICRYSCARNLMRTSHHISQAYAWFGASYFLYDIWSMYTVHVNTRPDQISTPSVQMSTPVPPPDTDQPVSGLRRFLRYVRLNPIIVGHHLFIGLFGFSVIVHLRGDFGDCVFGFVFLMEASTPFVSIRSVLSRFNLKSTKLYIYNGFAMLFIFFLCRVFMFPYVMYMYASTTNMDFLSAVASLPTGCKVSMSVLMLPQLYWFYLMVKGATKILREPSAKKGKAS